MPEADAAAVESGCWPPSRRTPQLRQNLLAGVFAVAHAAQMRWSLSPQRSQKIASARLVPLHPLQSMTVLAAQSASYDGRPNPWRSTFSVERSAPSTQACSSEYASPQM